MNWRLLVQATASLLVALASVPASSQQLVLPPWVDADGSVHFQQPANAIRPVGRADDELAIIRLNSLYQALIDDDRRNDWVDTWTNSGTFVSPLGNAVGKSALLYLISFLEDPQYLPQGGGFAKGKRHLLGLPRVEFVNDRLAIGQAECLIMEATVIPSVPIASCRYQDIYEKVQGRWYFRQRRQDVDRSWGPAGGRPDIFSVQSVLDSLAVRISQLEAAAAAAAAAARR